MSLRTCKECGLSSDDLSLFKKNTHSLHGCANLCLDCAAKRSKHSVDKKRALLDEFKRQPCAICGRTFPPCAMDFHHIDESVKEFGLAQYAYTAISTEDVLREVSKCMVICACCHRILHFDKEESDGN